MIIISHSIQVSPPSVLGYRGHANNTGKTPSDVAKPFIFETSRRYNSVCYCCLRNRFEKIPRLRHGAMTIVVVSELNPIHSVNRR